MALEITVNKVYELIQHRGTKARRHEVGPNFPLSVLTVPCGEKINVWIVLSVFLIPHKFFIFIKPIQSRPSSEILNFLNGACL